MKGILYFLTSLLLFGTLSSCQKDCDDQDRQPDYDQLLFGKFYGMCMGVSCVEIFKIENESLYEDTTDHYPFGSTPYDGKYVPLSSAKYDLVNDLPDYVPGQLLNETDTVIGMPDAYDQGGYYVEVKDSNKTRFWLIDTDKQNIPDYLHSFVDTLNSYINKLE